MWGQFLGLSGFSWRDGSFWFGFYRILSLERGNCEAILQAPSVGFEPHGPGQKVVIPSVFAERATTPFSCVAAVCPGQMGLVESRARVGGEKGLRSKNTIAMLLKVKKKQMLRAGRVGPRQAR